MENRTRSCLPRKRVTRASRPAGLKLYFAPDTRKNTTRSRARRQKIRATSQALRDPSPSPPPISPPPVSRPHHNSSKASRRKALARDPPAPSSKHAPSSTLNPNIEQPKQKQIHSKLYEREKELRDAVAFWDEQKGERDDAGKLISKSYVAKLFNFPKRTFCSYVTDNVAERLIPGARKGKNSLVSSDNREFLIQHAIRHDRANEGLSTEQIIANTMQIQPDLSRDQAKNYVVRTWKKYTKGGLKAKPVKAQKTTSKRSMCSVAQQFRWFKMYEKALDRLRAKNTGVCRKTGKSFGELIEYFIIGADETCMM
mmetsp:Transcript_38277/g.92336  ORF Transcript_38277/g.92336 Transcript_38277/m.92336 type:complete len:312 (-) Transcript_38277:1658-2593(-)